MKIFQEIAANISSHDFEHYANLMNVNTLNNICKSKWSAPPWPASQFQQSSGQLTSEQGSPTNEEAQINLTDDDLSMDTKQMQFQSQQHQNLIIDPQTMSLDQLRLITQFQVKGIFFF